MLPGVYPELGTIDDVRAHLEMLRLLDLVNPDREEDESHLFKHAVTQEVAYESLPYALRATLHGHVGASSRHAAPRRSSRASTCSPTTTGTATTRRRSGST